MSTMSTVPPLRRDPDGKLVAGVCSGIGRRMGIDPLIVRIAVVAAALAGGWGVALYLLGWALIPGPDGTRLFPEMPDRRSWQVAAGMGCLVLAAMLVLRELGLWFGDGVVWPLVLASAGGGLVWRQAQGAGVVGGIPRLGREALGRLALGVALVVGAALIFLWLNDALRPARDVLLAVVVFVLAIGLLLAPWWLRLVRSLAEERAARIRSQERAEVAAHLHDSVLQTLALLQKRADDPRAVATLARRQERELRAWLNGADRGRAETVVQALEDAAAEVEARHQVVVEVVAVGDCPLDPRMDALVAAAGEALTNAAKFAGDDPISVFAEIDDRVVEVFVRDRGPGFDLDAVPGDRRGIRESIVGRLERHGGRAAVHAAPGTGTEVELCMDRA